MSLMYFCFYPAFQWDNIVGNLLLKARVQKNIKKGDGHVGGLSIEAGVQTFCTLILRG